MCSLSEVFEFCHFFNFTCLISMFSLSAQFVVYLSFPCVLVGRLPDFPNLDCLNVFPFVFVSSLNKAIPSANLGL